ncbi:hypothetical protein P9314_02860 [Paenibacillus validus]|uniref:hypothetical protein n=1 Tax=Paenibacillaceae TaxID=186822 RepID=UPI000FD85F3D|nr:MULTISPECIES: hypothetical protein [Paenibacillaceae]MDR7319549.1 hypothetical protein [Brevibacillus nitrificans]MED4599644.1 hypothetical protein [Paenibacillus validus]MED4604592.1 hypothetical protein [Paenibacillus validus]
MQEERILCLDHYEHGIVVRALNMLRNDLIGEQRPTDAVDDLLLKAIAAPYNNRKRRGHHEAR